ncbi:MAG: hypothetical protein NTU88_10015 [Armatimonadetes bacterium]|nr:hypothetical protein [Armatimonadota bacterium]
MARVVVLVAVILAVCSTLVWAQECPPVAFTVSITFPAPNQAYRAVCIMDGGALKVVFYRDGKLVRQAIYKRPTTPMDVRSLTLQGRHGRDIRAILVQCSGGSVAHMFVLKLDPRTHRVSKLAYGADKGGVDYGYDRLHRLTGMRFHYMRWHVDADKPLTGHVLTAIDYKWVPSRQAFRVGRVHVDKEAEAQASLVDILSAIGSDYYLGVSQATDEANKTITYYYRPVGILRDKTPAALRRAKQIKVTVRYDDRDNEPHERIINILAVEPREKLKADGW